MAMLCLYYDNCMDEFYNLGDFLKPIAFTDSLELMQLVFSLVCHKLKMNQDSKYNVI